MEYSEDCCQICTKTVDISKLEVKMSTELWKFIKTTSAHKKHTFVSALMEELRRIFRYIHFIEKDFHSRLIGIFAFVSCFLLCCSCFIVFKGIRLFSYKGRTFISIFCPFWSLLSERPKRVENKHLVSNTCSVHCLMLINNKLQIL